MEDEGWFFLEGDGSGYDPNTGITHGYPGEVCTAGGGHGSNVFFAQGMFGMSPDHYDSSSNAPRFVRECFPAKRGWRM